MAETFDQVKVNLLQEYNNLNPDASIKEQVAAFGVAIKKLIEVKNAFAINSVEFKSALKIKIKEIVAQSQMVRDTVASVERLTEELKLEKEKDVKNIEKIKGLEDNINILHNQIELSKTEITETLNKIFTETTVNVSPEQIKQIIDTMFANFNINQAGGYSYSNTGRGINKNKSRRSKKGGKSVRKRSKKVVRKRTKGKSKRRYRK